MERYDFAMVCSFANEVALYCTDSSEIALLISQLKRYFPQLHLEQTRNLPSNELYFCSIKQLSSRDMDVAWWTMKQLCSRGWEPLGAAGEKADQAFAIRYLDFQFRRRIQSPELAKKQITGRVNDLRQLG